MFKLKRTKICLIAASTWRPPLFDIPIFWKNSCWDSIKIWCKNLYSGREGRTEFILFLASGYHLVSTNLTEILYNSGSNPGEECLRKGTWHEISIEDHEEKKLNELMKPQKILHQYLLLCYSTVFTRFWSSTSISIQYPPSPVCPYIQPHKSNLPQNFMAKYWKLSDL